MCNEGEGELWRVDITLMYAEHVPFLTSNTPHANTLHIVTPSQEQAPVPMEKTLKELLGEQGKGEGDKINVGKEIL